MTRVTYFLYVCVCVIVLNFLRSINTIWKMICYYTFTILFSKSIKNLIDFDGKPRSAPLLTPFVLFIIYVESMLRLVSPLPIHSSPYRPWVFVSDLTMWLHWFVYDSEFHRLAHRRCWCVASHEIVCSTEINSNMPYGSHDS